MASIPRVRLGLALAASTALVAGALTVVPSTADAVGVLGPAKALSSPATYAYSAPPAVASLADGSTAVAWAGQSQTQLFVRTRGPHTGSWSSVRTIGLPAGWTVDLGLLGSSVPTMVALGPARFLLVWHEKNGSSARIRTARFTTTSAITVQALTSDSPQTTRVAANPSGRAVVAWTNTTTLRAWFSVLGSATGSWSAPALVAGNVESAFPTPAVAVNGSLCMIWLDPPGGFTERSRCRVATAPPTAGHTWASGLGVARSLGPVRPLIEPQVADLTASGNHFVAAVPRLEAGSSSWPGSSATPPTSVRVLELGSAAATSWAQRALYRQPDQLFQVPTLQTATDGSVALRMFRMQGDISVPASHYSVTTFIAGRTPAGAWTPMRAVSTFATGDASILTIFNSFAVGPGGVVAYSSMSPKTGSVPSWTVLTAVGSAAGGFLAGRALLNTAFASVPAIAGTGQITYAINTYDGSHVTVSVRTTALAGGAS